MEDVRKHGLGTGGVRVGKENGRGDQVFGEKLTKGKNFP